jgi:hypothetical protein
VRSVSLEINLADDHVAPLLVRRDGFLLLPLARLPRDRHTPITVVDETGAVLPRLNASEERALALDALRITARAALGQQDPEPATMVRIAAVLHREREPGAFDDHVGAQVSKLAKHVGFMGLLSVLYADFYLVVFLPETSLPRRALTYHYEEQPRLRDPGTGNRRSSAQLSALGRVLRRTRVFLRHAIWPTSGLWMQVACSNVEEATSYHVDIRAPYDVELHDAVLYAPGAGPGGGLELVGDDNQSLTRTHLFLGPPPLPLTGVLVDLRLAPVMTGMIRSTTLISFLITGVLTAALLYAHTVSEKALFNNPDRSSSTAVLLLAPAILAAVLASPHRHSMTTRLHWETRLTVAVACLAVYVAATAVAVRVSQARLVTILLGAVILAGLCTVRLVVQWIRLGSSRRHTSAALRQQAEAG